MVPDTVAVGIQAEEFSPGYHMPKEEEKRLIEPHAPSMKTRESVSKE